MARLESVLQKEAPDLVLVVGDVNSTLAAALTAVKMGCRVAHVEAGLRSFDREMPEETNRIVTDAVSDLLFTTEPAANENLAREGVPTDRVHFVGNVMIDTLLRNRDAAERSTILERLGLRPRAYAALTLHRPSNVDDPAVFGRILDALEAIQRELPVVFPVHPRTRNALGATALGRRAQALPGLRLVEPLGHLDFLKLMAHQVIEARQRLELMKTRSAKERVILYLDLHAGPQGFLTLKSELQDIASELGLTREAFYRTLASLERAGAIERSGARIALKRVPGA
jgi:UDP-N-acetylglucosamine 2-epimerase (non-hydrolysing)